MKSKPYGRRRLNTHDTVGGPIMKYASANYCAIRPLPTFKPFKGHLSKASLKTIRFTKKYEHYSTHLGKVV